MGHIFKCLCALVVACSSVAIIFGGIFLVCFVMMSIFSDHAKYAPESLQLFLGGIIGFVGSFLLFISFGCLAEYAEDKMKKNGTNEEKKDRQFEHLKISDKDIPILLARSNFMRNRNVNEITDLRN